MSVNFNVAMLRSIQQPIEESLEAALSQLSQYMAGTLPSDAFSAAQHAHLVYGSLTVIGCQAAARIAASLDDALDGIARPDRRGWDAGKTQAVARAASDLTQGLLQHLRHILTDDEDIPVRLWPSWNRLSLAMDGPPGVPEELFEPDPDFEDLHFAPLAEDYLLEVSSGMADRLTAALNILATSTSPTAVTEALRAALKVFDWAYGLRHTRGYQAYWLALRARCSIGLLEMPPLPEDQDKAEWNVLLREALLEIRKFAQNNRRVHPELLLKTVRPMLLRWPPHWVASHPILAEADRRLGFSLFWSTVDEVESPSANQAISLFASSQDELLELVAQIKQDWGKYVVGEGHDIATTLEKDVALLVARRSMFTDQATLMLLDLIAGTLTTPPPPGRVDDDLAVELASAVLLLDEAIERRGRLSAMSDAQSELQRNRLVAARQGRTADLRKMSPLRWDAKRQERQLRLAHTTIFYEIRQDIQYIEDALSEGLLEDAARLDVSKIRSSATIAAAVLRLLAAPAAADILEGLLSLIEAAPDRDPASAVTTAVTMGIAGLSAYIAARESGDEEAGHLLDSAYRAVLNRSMPSGTVLETTHRPAPDALSEQLQASTEPQPSNAPRSVVSAPESVEAPSIPQRPLAPTEPSTAALIRAPGGYIEQRKGIEIEIFFLEEMDQVLAEIATQRTLLSRDPSNAEALLSLRRQFHTIKGSGRLAGFKGLGEAAYRVEALLNANMEGSRAYSPASDAVVEAASIWLSAAFVALRNRLPVTVEEATLQSWFASSLIASDSLQSPSSEASSAEPSEHSGDLIAESSEIPSHPNATVSVWPPVCRDPTEHAEEIDAARESSSPSLPLDGDPSSPLAVTEDSVLTAAVLTAKDSSESEASWGLESSAIASPQDEGQGAPPPMRSSESTDSLPAPKIVSALGSLPSPSRASSDVWIEGLGPVDGETYALMTEDLRRHIPVLAAAAALKPGSKIDIEPVHRAAHTTGSLGALLNMASLARMGRALEHYMAAFGDEHEVCSRDIAWTPEGQAAARGLFAMVRSLVDDRRLLDVDTQALSGLEAAFPRRAFQSAQSPSQEMPDEGLALASAGHDPASIAPNPPELAESLASGPMVLESESEDPSSEEDRLWNEVFDCFSRLSTELRRIGPLLVALDDRRK